MNNETQAHLTTLRGLLSSRLAELQVEVRGAQQAHGVRSDRSTDVTDLKDEAELHREVATDEAQEARDLAEMRQVEAALHRLDAGRYGDCAGCGDPILLERLFALPAAERCAACQVAEEHRLAVRA